MNDQLRLCALRADPLSADEVLQALSDPGSGGQVIFLGRVRDHDHGQPVRGLGYQAHPSADARLESVCRAVGARHPEVVLAAVHRTGELAVGEIAVIVGAASAHRDAAFAAARDLIDSLKATVPIWKQQRFTDGSDEWVGLP
ncbi:MAG: molybdenum cofactor biosynthesis protein MoaE [Tetrasphaera sp.]